MTLTDCQLLSIVAQLGTFAAAAERLHITPSAVSHAVSGVEAECGFPLFTRTKSGVTLTAAAEKLMPAIQQMLASSESLDQSIAQINGMHKGALRLGVFNSACVTWLPKIVPGFRAAFPGIDVQIYQGSYDDITGWLKTGAVELGFLSNSSAHDLDFEPLYDDRLICIAPPDYQPRRPGVVRAEELRSQPFVSQQSDVDADIQSYFKKNDLHVSSRCYIVDDQSMIAMVACGQGLALMPELMFKEGAASAGCQVLQLEPAAKRTIGLACLSRTALSPAARPVAQAICRLKPPVYASTSSSSPAKYSPSVFLDAMVLGSTSPTFTPPAVMMASAMGRGPDTGMRKPFRVSSRRRRSPFVRSWALRSEGTSAR